ncbi:hypothetical protein CEXT_242761 [Caerostris extrusa]|uniref:Uncharacterized protein n=1 Tax=Caerostris extrusa TaxID=172846 RepID=A0AAV4NUF3_CAEEX|nr:hypothetical protein CEXT_242761 [Caerostris extrusa]
MELKQRKLTCKLLKKSFLIPSGTINLDFYSTLRTESGRTKTHSIAAGHNFRRKRERTVNALEGVVLLFSLLGMSRKLEKRTVARDRKKVKPKDENAFRELLDRGQWMKQGESNFFSSDEKNASRMQWDCTKEKSRIGQQCKRGKGLRNGTETQVEGGGYKTQLENKIVARDRKKVKPKDENAFHELLDRGQWVKQGDSNFFLLLMKRMHQECNGTAQKKSQNWQTL